jgi:hydrogenase expression/formation protein HypC
MCLAIPGRLIAWLDRDPLLARGQVEFAGIRRECHLACVPEAEIGDYLVVHAGIAISRVDAAEAERLIRELNTAGEPTVPPTMEEEP